VCETFCWGRPGEPRSRMCSVHNVIPNVLGVIGYVLLSTFQGIMTDREAREKKIGGELLCYPIPSSLTKL
jgi:small subunit ribosomal protein S8